MNEPWSDLEVSLVFDFPAISSNDVFDFCRDLLLYLATFFYPPSSSLCRLIDSGLLVCRLILPARIRRLRYCHWSLELLPFLLMEFDTEMELLWILKRDLNCYQTLKSLNSIIENLTIHFLKIERCHFENFTGF